MDFTLREAEVLFDGRLVRLLFTSPVTPRPAESPDWRPGWLRGLRATLGGRPLQPLGVMAVDWTVTPDQCWPEPAPRARLDGRFLARVAYADRNGREVDLSGPYADFRSHEYWVALSPGTALTIRLPHPVPAGQTARIYLSDPTASYGTFRRAAADIPPGTETHTISSPPSASASAPDPLTCWVLHALIDGEPVTLGSAATLEVPAGLLTDDSGRATAAGSIDVVNRSLVGPDGFTDPSLGMNKLAVHVSSSRGRDDAPGSPDRPVQTVERAFALLRAAPPAPATIRLLRGDRFTEATWRPHWRPGHLDRLVIEDYWHDGFGADPATRPVLTARGEKPPIAWHTGFSRQIGPLFLRRLHVLNAKVGLVTAARAVVIDDCVLERSTASFQSRDDHATQEVVLLRSAFIDAARDSDRVQGLFCHGARRVTISQCVFDRCGYIRSDFSARNIYSHAIYLQNSVGEAAVWGNWILRGGSHGVQLRSCGLIAGNVFARNALGSFIKTGGTQARNLYLQSDDISPKARRGFGAIISGSPIPSFCQRVEGCLFLHSLGGQPRAIQCTESVEAGDTPGGFQEIRHNLVLDHGVAVMLADIGLRCVIRANVFNGPERKGLYLVKSPGPHALDTLAADLNVYHVPRGGEFVEKGPFRDQATWVRSGRDQHSEFTPNPTSASRYGLADYARDHGLDASEAALLAALRTRPAGTWPQWFSTDRAYESFLRAYAPNARSPLAAGPWSLRDEKGTV